MTRRTNYLFQVALLPLSILCACAAHTANDEQGPSEEAARVDQAHSIAASPEEYATESELPDGTPGEVEHTGHEKATDCEYISWCNAPRSASRSGTDYGTVCVVRKGCATRQRCREDALAVCGGVRQPSYMQLLDYEPFLP